MSVPFTAGDRVTFQRYGQTATGTVATDQTSCIVWVTQDLGDGATRTIWMHEMSLTKTPA